MGAIRAWQLFIGRKARVNSRLIRKYVLYYGDARDRATVTGTTQEDT